MASSYHLWTKQSAHQIRNALQIVARRGERPEAQEDTISPAIFSFVLLRNVKDPQPVSEEFECVQ
jgi:hypothetical protein